MPAGQFKRLNLDYLYPPFRDALFELIARCNDRGVRYVATLGYRTYEEQDQLYRLGRDIPGKVVTKARGGESQHCFGLAVDFVRDLDPSTAKVEPGWAEEDYTVLIEEVNKMGLHSGVSYRDRYHVGWPGYWNKKTVQVLDNMWREEATDDVLDRLNVVWKHIDQQGPHLPSNAVQ